MEDGGGGGHLLSNVRPVSHIQIDLLRVYTDLMT